MPISIANGPVSWGVYYSDDPTNIPWQGYLDEVASAGFRWTELGPIGYMSEDPAELREELDRRGLRLVAGFIFERLHDAAARSDLVAITHRTCRLLGALRAKYYVIIDNLPPERAKTAGRGESAPRLASDTWRSFMVTIRNVAAIARDEYGLSPVIHPHVGGYLEFQDEIEAALSDLSSDLVGLCIDTGHCAYAGVDPIGLYRRHADRVRYFHFKNIDKTNHNLALAQQLDLFGAISKNVFCPLSRGVVDFEHLKRVMAANHYEGWATVEQDSDPRSGARPRDDAVASLRYLRGIGLVDSD